MDLELIGNFSYEKYNETVVVEETPFDDWADAVVRGLHLYYTPILIILGMIGNLISLYVFFTSKLRLQATSYYLSALALSDTLFLLQLLPPWLGVFQMTGLFHHRGICEVSVYVSYVACCLSAWLVVAFTVERFVAVLYPLQRSIVCSVKRTRYVIAGLTLAAILLNIPVLRFAMPINDDCIIDTQYMALAARFNLVDTALSFTIPSTIIIILNTWITVGVCQLERVRRQLTKAGQSSIRQGLRPVTKVGCTRSQQKVTRMLLIVSSVFVMLNMPAYCMRLAAYAYDLHFENLSGRWKALQQLVLLLFDTNFGINFLLYCLSGQNFRQALKMAFPCTRRQATQAMTVRRTAAFRMAHYNSVDSLSSNRYATVSTSHVPETRRSCDRYISRWAFDNSRQRVATRAAFDAPNNEAAEVHSFPTTCHENIDRIRTQTTQV